MKKGFTLLEMIIAIGVFGVVITISLNSLLNISAVNKKAQAFRIVQDNLNFTLESMSKAIRTGYAYYCGVSDDDNTGFLIDPATGDYFVDDCVNGGPSFTFTDSKGTRVMYTFLNKKLQKSFDSINFEKLTSDEIQIEKSNFYVRGTGAGAQPLVTIGLEGSVTKQGIESATTLQITISQRAPDS